MTRQLIRFTRSFARHLWRAGLRALLAGVIFTACFLAAADYFGLPLPAPEDMLEKIEGVARLAEVLS